MPAWAMKARVAGKPPADNPGAPHSSSLRAVLQWGPASGRAMPAQQRSGPEPGQGGGMGGGVHLYQGVDWRLMGQLDPLHVDGRQGGKPGSFIQPIRHSETRQYVFEMV